MLHCSPFASSRQGWLPVVLCLLAGLTAPASALPAGPVPNCFPIHRFPGNDGKTHRITWDEKSLFIDNERLPIYSGEFHYWRLPSHEGWVDVLQKMKAAGYNAVSLYFHWGFHSHQPGRYDFSGIRDVERLLKVAEQVGLYVIARPGPYINAETSMGGLPAYLGTFGGESRTLDPENLKADLEWLDQINGILKRHQVTDGGGSVLLYQVENEQVDSLPKRVQYIEKLQEEVRADGITVPLFHNDWNGGHGYNVPGKPGGKYLDLYAFDTYPLNFDCGAPRGLLMDFEKRIRGYSPQTPLFIAEGQGGAYTAWGRDFQTQDCAKFVDANFVRQFAVNNLINGVTMFNCYMQYGGTNWGWTGDPDSGFTSYDYGAAISENRQLHPKFHVQKAFGYLQEAVKPLLATRENGRAKVKWDGAAVVEALRRIATDKPSENSVTGGGTQFIALRHLSSERPGAKSRTHFQLTLDEADAAQKITYERVPQKENTHVLVNGRDAKLLVADYAFHGHKLMYSTSDFITHFPLSTTGKHLLVLSGASEEEGETLLRFAHAPKVTVLQGQVEQVWDENRHDLRLNYQHAGMRVVKIEGETGILTLLILDRDMLQSTWKLAAGYRSVLVMGPHLVRTAHREGGVLELRGDLLEGGTLRVYGAGDSSISWNGRPLASTTDATEAQVSTLPEPPLTLPLPLLREWVCKECDPERLPDFDDSTWQVLDKATAANPKHGAGTHSKVVMDGDEYGFYEGDIWYRGHYTPEKDFHSITPHMKLGKAGMGMVWVNGTFVGVQTASMDTFSIPEGVAPAGKPAVISIVVRHNGHGQDPLQLGFSKHGRGLSDVRVPGADTVRWKIQGAAKVDPMRTLYNNGGLYGERQGWHLASSLPGAEKTAELVSSRPGIMWYHTTFDLAIPAHLDTTLAIKVNDSSKKGENYRLVFFVNGWNVGQYVNHIGPQFAFVIPKGFLQEKGKNTLSVVMTAERPQMGPDSLELIASHVTQGGARHAQ